MRWAARLLLMFLSMELVVRCALHVPAVRERAVRLPGLDTSAELGWYLRRAEAWRTGHLTHPERPWAHAVWDPELGWLPAIGDDGVGPRGRGPATAPREGARLVVVGDSFAYGLEVPPEQTFPHRLAAIHHDLDVLNLGVPGYGPDQIALRTRRDVPALRPDIVLLPAIGIDVPRAAAHFVAYAKPTLSWPGLVPEGVPVPRPVAVSRRVMLRSRLVDLVRVVVEKRTWADRVDGAGQEALHARVSAILDGWAQDVVRMGATPVVVILPTPDDLQSAAAGRDTRRESNRQLYRSWCARQTFPCVDAHELVRSRVAAPSTFRTGGHWSAEGHAVVAEVIDEVLGEAGLVDGP